MLQSPDQGRLQHTAIMGAIPGVGERHLSRRRRFTVQLPIQAVDRGLFQAGQLRDQSGPGTELDEAGGLLDAVA